MANQITPNPIHPAPERDDYDNPLKEALQHLLHRLLEWYFHTAFLDIDWSVPPEFLETELRQITPSSSSGLRRADKLAKVRLKSGQYEFVLVHAELEGDPSPDFDERMYVYNYRSYDLFRKPVASFAVLADAPKNWTPGTFAYSMLGTTVTLNYSAASMVEYRDRLEELESSDNPFALITLAELQTRATRQSPESRLEWKARITERLYERGMGSEEIRVTFQVIDWMMRLPEELDRSFQRRVEQIESRYKMPYVTSIERLARKDGRVEGRVEGQQEMLLTLLREKFVDVPASLAEQIAAISDVNRLHALFRAAVRLGSLKEFERQL